MTLSRHRRPLTRSPSSAGAGFEGFISGAGRVRREHRVAVFHRSKELAGSAPVGVGSARSGIVRLECFALSGSEPRRATLLWSQLLEELPPPGPSCWPGDDGAGATPGKARGLEIQDAAKVEDALRLRPPSFFSVWGVVSDPVASLRGRTCRGTGVGVWCSPARPRRVGAPLEERGAPWRCPSTQVERGFSEVRLRRSGRPPGLLQRRRRP